MLHVHNLAIRYHHIKPVLENLNFALKAGEIGCLLGASGGGKTTLLRAIAGFETPWRGTITVGGVAVSHPSQMVPPEKRQVGLMFQDYALFPHLTVIDNINFGLTNWDKPAQQRRCKELLSLMGIEPLAHRYPHELSGGQQQRVALARALAPRPRLLLLDEPFSNLDHALRETLSLEVRELIKKEGVTALMVTHNQTEAFVMADQLGILMHGTLQQWDTPYQVYHAPIDRQVASFIGAGKFIKATPINQHEVMTALGKFALSSCPTAPASEHLQWEVLIRPDDVEHDDLSQEFATVLDKTFRGADFLYTLALDNGETVLALIPSHHNHPIGERIGIRPTLDHVNVYVADRPTLQFLDKPD